MWTEETRNRRDITRGTRSKSRLGGSFSSPRSLSPQTSSSGPSSSPSLTGPRTSSISPYSWSTTILCPPVCPSVIPGRTRPRTRSPHLSPTTPSEIGPIQIGRGRVRWNVVLPEERAMFVVADNCQEGRDDLFFFRHHRSGSGGLTSRRRGHRRRHGWSLRYFPEPGSCFPVPCLRA